MQKRLPIVLASIMVLLLSACGVLQEPEEASAPIEAIPLEAEDSAEDTAETDDSADPTPLPAAEASADDAATDGPTIYTISQDASEVRFELDEDLRGERITVVGVTNQVAGEIAVDLNDLSNVQVGILQINARTLETDNDFRNRAIQNEILDTGAYEFITFAPTAVSGLPDSATIGEEISFTIDGDLTVRDTTQPASFTVTATAVSDTQLTGTATATINREQFGLTIPSVPGVANVEEEVDLIIDFTANAS